MKHCSNGPCTTKAAPSFITLKSVLNGRECAFPLSFVHPERFADLRAASNLMAGHGGMHATSVAVTTSLVQIAFSGLEDSERASCRGREVAAHLLGLGLCAAPQSLPAGYMPALEVRAYGPHRVLVSLYVEQTDGFCIVEPAARAIVSELARLIGAPAAPSFAIGAAEHRRVRVKGSLRSSALYHRLESPRQGHARVASLSEAWGQVLARYARAGHMPDLAFEHNARALSGMAAASALFGAAIDVVQAEGQTHAARWGGCAPLVRWEQSEDQLAVELEVPVALQRVRGVLNAAQIETACSIAEVDSTRALELACASVGLIASVSGLYGDLRAAAATLGVSQPLARRAQMAEVRAPLV